MERRDKVLLLSWPVYLTLFFLSERLIPAERCIVIQCAADKLIPFCEWFLIPYVSWYPLVAGSVIWLLRKDRKLFRWLQSYILITQMIGLICFFLLPSRQELRPDVFPREDLLTKLTGILYAVDTPTGVCPSMHVAWSLALISTWTRKRDCSSLWRWFMTVWCTLICISVVFVKQHSALDILGGLAAGMAAELILCFIKTRAT